MANLNESQPVEIEDPDKTENRKMQRKTECQKMNRWTETQARRTLTQAACISGAIDKQEQEPEPQPEAATGATRSGHGAEEAKADGEAD